MGHSGFPCTVSPCRLTRLKQRERIELVGRYQHLASSLAADRNRDRHRIAFAIADHREPQRRVRASIPMPADAGSQRRDRAPQAVQPCVRESSPWRYRSAHYAASRPGTAPLF